MKISINKNTLESAIVLTNSYVDKKDSSNIASHLLFEVIEDKLIIRASDYEIGINYKIKKIKVENAGFATANAKSILDIIKSLNNEDVVLETIENFLFIRQKGTKYKLPMFNYEDFPNFPSIEGKDKFDIDSSDLSRSLKKILPAVDTNNPKYSLNGALLDIKTTHINFVGTDTKRLAIFTLNKTNEKELNLCIPKKAILEMQKIFFEKIEIYYDENILIAKNDNFEFFTKLINDKFPDYERVIPKNITKEFIFKTEDFSDALKKINVITEKMKLNFHKNKLVFEGISLDNMEAKTELDIELDIEEEFNLCIKNKFITDFLNSIESETFKLSINEPHMAFLVSSEELQTVIMPVIL
ncbi:DNA polymerase III subunit beta [Campylobacter volucris]|uniref:DNA polymerase III subunit beta n=1 Tax=Campylobacter volucris TaxID=1031542 RepID=UPI0010592477|nr:DNA polymerase III subunit beta [Campylobacter volucris]MBF7044075.1 DNA polymerase III subunit beta [Campylobacter volucris]MBF7045919.1 DNA polymerase III subunit beta [Campylobacter volucris]MBF7047117.1 DNA polymerase III subunit beta [Campylobacter volucris]MBF7067838.1 DNA polymerase III subunit beta [Campylobacter volucris]MBF7068482.1 DNA polymerase III subunit beta [Campylobacter volucris]